MALHTTDLVLNLPRDEPSPGLAAAALLERLLPPFFRPFMASGEVGGRRVERVETGAALHGGVPLWPGEVVAAGTAFTRVDERAPGLGAEIVALLRAAPEAEVLLRLGGALRHRAPPGGEEGFWARWVVPGGDPPLRPIAAIELTLTGRDREVAFRLPLDGYPLSAVTPGLAGRVEEGADPVVLAENRSRLFAELSRAADVLGLRPGQVRWGLEAARPEQDEELRRDWLPRLASPAAGGGPR